MMSRKTGMVSIAYLLVFAPMVLASDGLGTYNEDLSGYGQPVPANHHLTWQKPHQVAPTVIDAKIVQAIRHAHSDDGLESYSEDFGRYGTGVEVVPTFAVTD